MSDVLDGMVDGAWLDRQDFTGKIDAQELVESGLCSGACLVSAPHSLDDCTCRCGGRYHGALSQELLDL